MSRIVGVGVTLVEGATEIHISGGHPSCGCTMSSIVGEGVTEAHINTVNLADGAQWAWPWVTVWIIPIMIHYGRYADYVHSETFIYIFVSKSVCWKLVERIESMYTPFIKDKEMKLNLLLFS